MHLLRASSMIANVVFAVLVGIPLALCPQLTSGDAASARGPVSDQSSVHDAVTLSILDIDVEDEVDPEIEGAAPQSWRTSDFNRCKLLSSGAQSRSAKCAAPLHPERGPPRN